MTKNIYFLLFFALPFISSAQDIVFADSYFKNALLQCDPDNNMAKNLDGDYFKIDANNDGEIQQSEAAQVSELMLASQEIAYFNGIDYFTNLVKLDCTNNGRTGTPLGSGSPISLDLSTMSNLKTLIAPSNKFYLGIGSFTNLEKLNINSSAGFSGTLDMTALTHLKYLTCDHSNITGLNLNGLVELDTLTASHNDIATIDLSQLAHLKLVDLSWSEVTSLDLSNHVELEILDCQHSAVATLNVNGCSNLKRLKCQNSYLTSLDAGNLSHLEELFANSSELASLNVTGDNKLKILNAEFCQLTQLDASNLPLLEELRVTGNQLTSLNIAGSTLLHRITCEGNQLTTLNCNDLVNLQSLVCHDNPLQTLYIKNGVDEVELLINENTSLEYICADASQVTAIQTLIADMHPDCVVDSNCLLQTEKFTQQNAIALHPNPAHDILNIETNDAIIISKINVYNFLGQLVLSSDAKTAIDVSGLQDGNYFLKITSNSGSIVKRFVKN